MTQLCKPFQPQRWAGLAAAVLLTACGGGGSGGDAASSTTSAADPGRATVLAATGGADRTATLAAGPQMSRYEAQRFLTQASFGPNADDAELLMKIGYDAWLNRQFGLAATSHRAWWEARDAQIKAVDATASAGQDQLWESFWKQALTGPDQLRQRMAFALSEIFVISAVDGSVGQQSRAMAAWLDMLGANAFGNYRDLLESVTLHPLMGLYLSWLKNRKPDSSGRVPDQNYAREVMQLFSIGLVKLNTDGTPQLVNGATVETYVPADVVGLSHVFTGWSWSCSTSSNSCFNSGSADGNGANGDPDRYFKPMAPYPQYHSIDAKNFLGVTIPAQTTATANPVGDLKTALDTLANHPNVGPFISRQLIQRLVTSNPSPAYVQAVAGVFNNNGAGVRGDLKAVLRAILTHPEAMTPSAAGGKVREPVLKLSAYLRAFPHSSATGFYRVGNTDSTSGSLGQTPLRSPSVFNFFRPGYVAPGTQAAAAGLVAPEMQLLNETTVASWVNYSRDNLSNGVGQSNTLNGVTRRDLQRDWSAELALAARTPELVSSITDKLLYGTASATLQNTIVTAVNKITIPAATGSNQAAIDTAKRNRVMSTVLLTLATPEFAVQK